MARGANRRKLEEPSIAIGSTASSGATGESDNAANYDRVMYLVNVTTLTAGSVTFVIQVSPNDGTTWFPLTTAEMVGNTGALTTTGQYHVSSTVPFGTRVRLAYTIVTGPVAMTVFPVFEKSGSVY
jgi:hypothetical protein